MELRRWNWSLYLGNLDWMAELEQTTFSSAAENAITRTISVTPGYSSVPNPTTREELAHLEEQYEVGWTSNEILKGRFKQVQCALF